MCPHATLQAKGAVAVLSMEHPVVQLSSSRASSSDDEFHVVAVSEVGKLLFSFQCFLYCSLAGPLNLSVDMMFCGDEDITTRSVC